MKKINLNKEIKKLSGNEFFYELDENIHQIESFYEKMLNIVNSHTIDFTDKDDMVIFNENDKSLFVVKYYEYMGEEWTDCDEFEEGDDGKMHRIERECEDEMVNVDTIYIHPFLEVKGKVFKDDFNSFYNEFIEILKDNDKYRVKNTQSFKKNMEVVYREMIVEVFEQNGNH